MANRTLTLDQSRSKSPGTPEGIGSNELDIKQFQPNPEADIIITPRV